MPGSNRSRATEGPGRRPVRPRVGSPEWNASLAAPWPSWSGRTARPKASCRDCGRQFNERSGGLLNRTQYPSGVIALVVLSHLRYRLTPQNLSEMFLQRAIVFSHETVREWEAKLTPHPSSAVRSNSPNHGAA
jgi:hypothetical protein